MSISAISAASSYEMPKQAEKPVKVEVAAPVAESVQVETKPVAAASGSGTDNDASEQEKGQEAIGGMLKAAVKHVNSKLKHAKTKCEFSYHEATNRISIKVLDKDTDEVIREIPPEKTLEMLEKMWELAGILVDEKR